MGRPAWPAKYVARSWPTPAVSIGTGRSTAGTSRTSVPTVPGRKYRQSLAREVYWQCLNCLRQERVLATQLSILLKIRTSLSHFFFYCPYKCFYCTVLDRTQSQLHKCLYCLRQKIVVVTPASCFRQESVEGTRCSSFPRQEPVLVTRVPLLC